jgi:hypothetical protein
LRRTWRGGKKFANVDVGHVVRALVYFDDAASIATA